VRIFDDFGVKRKPDSNLSRIDIPSTGPLSRLKVGTPDPVPDEIVDIPTLPSPDVLTTGLGHPEPGTKPPDVFVPNPTPLPGPTEFVAYEQPPDLLRMQAPVYPPLAREAGIEGSVLLRVLVSKEGKVLNAIVLSGNPILAEAARLAAFTAQFSPALQQHKPVPVWVQLPVVFSLK